MEYLDKIEVRNICIDGSVVFAKENIGKGKVVLQFKGLKVINKSGIHTLQIGPYKHLLVNEPWRYVNHSCNPNCGINDRVKLVAMRNIERDEEITFDYAMSELEMRMECQCDSRNCRKSITGYTGLSKNLKTKYKRFISSYLIIRV